MTKNNITEGRHFHSKQKAMRMLIFGAEDLIEHYEDEDSFIKKCIAKEIRLKAKQLNEDNVG